MPNKTFHLYPKAINDLEDIYLYSNQFRIGNSVPKGVCSFFFEKFRSFKAVVVLSGYQLRFLG